MDLNIIEVIKNGVESSDAVRAMWIAGSIADGYSDNLSDVDIWLDINDGKDEEIFTLVESILAGQGVLDVNLGEWILPPFSHKVYHLSHMNPYHFIEVTLHSHSDKYEFTEGIRKAKVIFDKDGITKPVPLDLEAHNAMLANRAKVLAEKLKVGRVSVEKEIQRGQFLDAMHNYNFWLLETILELARIKYSPLKYTYGLKHGNRDLPKDVAGKVESLCKIKSLDDFKIKIDEIEQLANELTKH